MAQPTKIHYMQIFLNSTQSGLCEDYLNWWEVKLAELFSQSRWNAVLMKNIRSCTYIIDRQKAVSDQETEEADDNDKNWIEV